MIWFVLFILSFPIFSLLVVWAFMGYVVIKGGKIKDERIENMTKEELNIEIDKSIDELFNSSEDSKDGQEREERIK